MAIPVKLQAFEGPLDLLLHLIDKNKVDIYDIPISMITKQYLAYIQEMEKQDMNIMSEFLVMAATLVDIKCRMLLPKEINEEGEEEDPRAELVEKLIEYKTYKYMSYELRDRQIDAERAMFKKPTIPGEVSSHRVTINYDKLIGDMNLAKLQDVFKSVMKRKEDKIDPVRSTFGRIEKDEVSMEQKMYFVEAYAKEHKIFSFRVLLEDQIGKMETIVTFLVVLELIKIGLIYIAQNSIFDDIQISYNEDAPAVSVTELAELG